MIDRLRLEKMRFWFENSGPVWKELSCDFGPQQTTWINGPSGGGKSLLLRILAGLETPCEGIYQINDQVVGEMSFGEFLPYRLRIGYSFDSGGLLSNRTLFENLLLPLVYHRHFSHSEAEARVQRWIERFRLTNVQNKRPFSVTGRERKSIVLIRAFIHRPEVAIIDDPYLGLKSEERLAFKELIEDSAAEGLKMLIYSSEERLECDMFEVRQLRLERLLSGSEAA